MPDESFTELAGERVALRRFHPGDVTEFVAYRSSAVVARYQSWDAPYPQEEGVRFVQGLMKSHPDTPGEWFQFAVALRATGLPIGDCQACSPASPSPLGAAVRVLLAAGHEAERLAVRRKRAGTRGLQYQPERDVLGQAGRARGQVDIDNKQAAHRRGPLPAPPLPRTTTSPPGRPPAPGILSPRDLPGKIGAYQKDGTEFGTPLDIWVKGISLHPAARVSAAGLQVFELVV